MFTSRNPLLDSVNVLASVELACVEFSRVHANRVAMSDVIRDTGVSQWSAYCYAFEAELERHGVCEEEAPAESGVDPWPVGWTPKQCEAVESVREVA